jgi:hypothetical protein
MVKFLECADEAIGFCCNRSGGESSYTRTLTTYLGDFLYELEEILGPRQKEWTILGIEFGGDRPRIWYPGKRKQVVVKLAAKDAKKPTRAMVHLAHEAVHLLAPSGGNVAPVIEEGAAALYQIQINKQFELGMPLIDSDYLNAAKMTSGLLERFPGAIKELRKKEPYFHRFTPKLLLETLSGLEESLAIDLCREFNSINPPPQ